MSLSPLSKPAPLTESTWPTYRIRIEQLQENSAPLWGELTAPALLAHLRRSFEITLREVDVTDISKPYLRHLAYFLFFRLFTNWPKGKIKAPQDFFPEDAPLEFEQERLLLYEKVERFTIKLLADPSQKATSPMLGPVSFHRWSYVHGAHLNHHLKQFGL